MEIVINANDNTISIDGIEIKCHYPVEVSRILEQVLTSIISIDRELPDNISLDLINEDSRKNIGEW